MYTQYFGLRENPFALPPDPRYLYMSLRHQEALAHLMYGITQGGGFVQLTGEVGTGKTMMIRALLERLPENTQITLVLYPMLSVEEFVATICDDLGIPRSGNVESVKALIDTLNRYLLDNHAQGRRTVLLIDEAHKLSHDVLEQVRLLTNLETTKEKLLQILLVGQPELVSLLKQPGLRQLAQRITARYNLRALLPHESSEYVRHRLKVAGASSNIFTRAALAWIHRLSGGTPRLINAICDRALLGAYARGKNEVTGAIARRAAAEIGHTISWNIPWRAAALAASIVLIGIGAWQWAGHTGSAATAVAAPAPTGSTAVSLSGKSMVPTRPMLAELFSDPNTRLDTDSAFVALFAQWRKNYEELPGKTGCERAQYAGLRCLYSAGTWNNLRQINRPAVIELIDARDRRHHVLVKALSADRVVLDVAGQAYEFPLAEVERYWYGKFLSLWSPPPSGDAVLRRGARGPGVLWLRNALARSSGQAGMGSTSDVFDIDLEEQLKMFQRQHHLDDDGVAGPSTLMQLASYNGETPAPLLSKTATETGLP